MQECLHVGNDLCGAACRFTFGVERQDGVVHTQAQQKPSARDADTDPVVIIGGDICTYAVDGFLHGFDNSTTTGAMFGQSALGYSS